ncbi:MAG: CBS domain-containing protein, partial [Flammeovirgaceae bacterium]|nr:CBS domain-containing protein [Flammeovirgaceae bacterium]
YATSCKAKEDVLLYLCPFSVMDDLLVKHQQLALFVATHFAEKLSRRAEKLKAFTTDFNSDGLKQVSGWEDFQVINSKKNIITCLPETTIKDAAMLMNQHQIGSLVVTDKTQQPVGIITDADFRRKVVGKNRDVNKDSIDSCMSSPVITISENPTISSLILAMGKHKIRHFVVTEDGSSGSQVTGIISERDIVVALGNNPLALIKEIQQATDVATLKIVRDKVEQLLKNYLKQEISIGFVANFITEVNDALIAQAMGLAQSALKEKGLTVPNVGFCWLSLGSEGRKEQLLRTDLDNALLFLNPDEDEAVVSYFLELGKIVVDILVSCGFQECPGEIMASNPKWCVSLKQWKNYFNEWILEPDPKALMHANIFFDFRAVYGNKEITADLKSHIFSLIKMDKAFLNFFAGNALQNPPPLSLFRNFVVEKKGEHLNEFDIKARAMMPISDGARVLAYSYEIEEESTMERLAALAILEENQAELFEELKMAYGILVRLRGSDGLKNNDSGRYIDMGGLNKLERQNLKNIFKIIGEFQTLIRVRFQTDLLR